MAMDYSGTPGEYTYSQNHDGSMIFNVERRFSKFCFSLTAKERSVLRLLIFV